MSDNSYGILPPKACLLILCIIIMMPVSGMAQRSIERRDYMINEHERYHGDKPLIKIPYAISRNEPGKSFDITFTMVQYPSLLVRIEPVTMPAGVILYGSRPLTPGLLKAVWADDNIRQPVIFWTHEFWKSNEKCSATGCPKIRFQSTRGAVRIIILDVRK